MNLDRTLTATVYVVNNEKVLLHMHKKHKSLFPLGGHMLATELPHETAIREAYEESGLHVHLFNDEELLSLGRVIQVPRPAYVLLENIGHPIENIDFIYFASCSQFEVCPGYGESNEFHWLTSDQIIENKEIKPHVKEMALKAIRVINRFNIH